jgi:hypothetical protein
VDTGQIPNLELDTISTNAQSAKRCRTFSDRNARAFLFRRAENSISAAFAMNEYSEIRCFERRGY